MNLRKTSKKILEKGGRRGCKVVRGTRPGRANWPNLSGLEARPVKRLEENLEKGGGGGSEP